MQYKCSIGKQVTTASKNAFGSYAGLILNWAIFRNVTLFFPGSHSYPLINYIRNRVPSLICWLLWLFLFFSAIGGLRRVGQMDRFSRVPGSAEFSVSRPGKVSRIIVNCLLFSEKVNCIKLHTVKWRHCHASLHLLEEKKAEGAIRASRQLERELKEAYYVTKKRVCGTKIGLIQ